MFKKEKISFQCPCEKEHPIEETYLVVGSGNSAVEVRCPNPQCPSKNPLLSFTIPFELKRKDELFKHIQFKKP